MVIRASSAAQINTLIADLDSSSSITRDAAIARLTVIGARAVDRLCGVAAAGKLAARVAALRALEAIGDPRAFEPAVAALAHPETVTAGLGVARRLLRSTKETEAIEVLTAVAIDDSRPTPLRIDAAQALGDLGSKALTPLLQRLERDEIPEIREWAAARRRRRRASPPSITSAHTPLEEFAQQGLPDDPGVVHRAIAHDGAAAPLSTLRQVIQAIRQREETAAERQLPEWVIARAAAHVVLAARGSRIALYDLRESIGGSARPLPVEFLSAVTSIGDASCLEALAAAYARSTRSGEEWWRQHLRRAFHMIVQRDHITRRHPAMKKVLARWPAIVN